MKTYIINLARAERRRRHVICEAEKCGLDYELVEAVEGTALSETEIEEKCDLEVIRKFPNWLTKGMLGAALSHRSVYKRIIDEGDPAGFVLEDDVALSPDLVAVIAAAEKVIAENEVILFHYSSFEPLGLSRKGGIWLTDDRMIMYPMFLKGVVSAAGYMISRGAAQSMYEWLLPIRLAPDSWLDFHLGGAVKNFRCVYPMPMNVIGAKSTIEASNQSAARVGITEFIDKHEIPILHPLFTRMRLKGLEKRANFHVTEEESPLSPTR